MFDLFAPRISYLLREGAGDGSGSMMLTAGNDAEDGNLSFVEDVLFTSLPPDGWVAIVAADSEALGIVTAVCQRAECRAT